MGFNNTAIMLSNLKLSSIIQPGIVVHTSEIEFEGRKRLDEGQWERDLYLFFFFLNLTPVLINDNQAQILEVAKWHMSSNT